MGKSTSICRDTNPQSCGRALWRRFSALVRRLALYARAEAVPSRTGSSRFARILRALVGRNGSARFLAFRLFSGVPRSSSSSTRGPRLGELHVPSRQRIEDSRGRALRLGASASHAAGPSSSTYPLICAARRCWATVMAPRSCIRLGALRQVFVTTSPSMTSDITRA